MFITFRTLYNYILVGKNMGFVVEVGGGGGVESNLVVAILEGWRNCFILLLMSGISAE